MGNNLVKVDELKSILGTDDIKKQMKAALKERAPQFMVSLTNLFQSDLSACDPNLVVKCAMIAATLNLPIDKNLGFAYIIPYKKGGGKSIPQFQIGYKGFIQLALRTGQYRRINAIPIYKENFISFDPLKEDLKLDFTPKPNYKNKPVGFAAYFELLNGFGKTMYWDYDKIMNHAETYSQSYKAFLNKKVYSSIWNDNPVEMGNKTLLTQLLKKYGILSILMEKAILEDQKDANGNYIDNQKNVNLNPEENINLVSEINKPEEPEEAEITKQADPIDVSAAGEVLFK